MADNVVHVLHRITGSAVGLCKNVATVMKDVINEANIQFLAVVLSLLLVILTIVVFRALRRRSSLRRGILLMGNCESGKTALFLRLTKRPLTVTCTSIKENIGFYQTRRNKTLKLIDIPGHERLRQQFLTKYAQLCRCIVYMVDSSMLATDIRDVADYLYTILAHPTISKIHPPVLIACNKQDVDLAKGAVPAQALLEKEINTLRVTKSGALEGLEDSEQLKFLGKRNKDFEFADLKPIHVYFIECHVTNHANAEAYDVQAIEDWLDKVA